MGIHALYIGLYALRPCSSVIDSAHPLVDTTHAQGKQASCNCNTCINYAEYIE